MQAFPSASSPISAEVARQAVQWWLQLNSGQAQARQHILLDQGDQLACDLQPGAIFVGRHDGLSPARRRTCNNA